MKIKLLRMKPAVLRPVSLLARLLLVAPLCVNAMNTAPSESMSHNMDMTNDVMSSQKVGSYRIELHVLPPEPFYSASQVKAQHLQQGMLITGGGPALAPDANPAPTHHLIVHVFDQVSGAAISDAKVTLDLAAADAAGHATGPQTSIPVVIMQAIGGGPGSTHYGNNVQVKPGAYVVTVTVNGASATFPAQL
jgi:hypothetical protein